MMARDGDEKVDWDWLAATYALGGWRITGVRATGTRDRQELTLTLERDVSVGMPAFTAASLFAGMGGFSLAFARAGFSVIWANELDRWAAATHRVNFPSTRLIEKSVTELSVAADGLAPVDVLTAGFPCQPFSVAGAKRGFNDQRGRLFFEITRILAEFGEARPKIVILENVPHLRTHDSGRTFAEVTAALQGAGYWFDPGRHAAVLNAAVHAGIPQNRPRLFMAAVRSDLFPRNDFRLPVARVALRPLDEFLDTAEPVDHWHYFPPDSKWVALFEQASSATPGSRIFQMRRTYVRAIKRDVAPAMLASMGEGGNNHLVIRDSRGYRRLTVEECMRLQGFDPVGFRFPTEVSRSQQYKQIGNAVPVPLARMLAEEAMRILAPSQRLDIIPADWEGFEDELAVWRGRHVG
jgi:DNA (cytosine-5)-methyltransferase 1